MSATADRSGPAAVERFAAALRQHPWFAAVGQSGTGAEETVARAYLTGLGFAGCALVWAADWRTAERITRAPDWNADWWRAEETARQALVERAERRLGQTGYLAAMNRVVLASSDAVMGPAAIAAARSGVADQALIRVAAGAASQACHQAALALAADAGENHPFALKFRLYAGGRWPLALIGRGFHLF